MLFFDGVIFDLDGVITKTALIHASAWKEMFDEYLRLREERDGEAFKEFTKAKDYLTYVDGKPRYEGVRSFLESRGIHIPYGSPEDPAGKESICGLGNRKNEKFREVLEKDGVEVYASTIELIKALKEKGARIGVASSSKNCRYVLQSADLDDLFETRVDGLVSAELGLKGKPEGDIFVKAAENLGLSPGRTVIVEDAVSGVQAGRNGGFGLVIGVSREDNEAELRKNGADVVIKDFSGVGPGQLQAWFEEKNT